MWLSKNKIDVISWYTETYQSVCMFNELLSSLFITAAYANNIDVMQFLHDKYGNILITTDSLRINMQFFIFPNKFDCR